MTHAITDKEFFQHLQHTATELSGRHDISSSFPYFCLQIFFPNLTEEDIDTALQGLGSNDDSIDAFWVDYENETIHIAQFKSVISYKKATESYARKEWFSFLQNVPDKLSKEEWTEMHRNTRIREEIGYEFQACTKSKYKVQLYLFHLGKVSQDIQSSYPQIEYLGFNELKEKWLAYQSMTSQELPRECEIDVNYSNDITQPHILPYEARYNLRKKATFLTILTGRELMKLMKKYTWQLFDRNIRFYLGTNNKINTKIIDSALNTPEIFYCFNNGITLTCTRCKYKKDKAILNLEYPQIINGAQTMNSLYEAYQQLRKKYLVEFGQKEHIKAEIITDQHFSKIKVLCRIVESTKGEDTDFAVNLTRYNNSQNDIRIFDFFSNNPEQEEIQKRMLNYGYFYERKRGEKAYLKKSKDLVQGKKKLSDLKYANVKIDIRKMTSVFQAYNGKPSYQDCDYKNILENKTKEDYNRLFGNKADITNDKVSEMILAINLYDAIQEQVKAYTDCIRILDMFHTQPHNENWLNRFKTASQKILFFSNNIRQTICQANSYAELQQVIDIFREYSLLTRGSYLLTALFRFILIKNNYINSILKDNLFANREFIKDKIVIKWIRNLFKGYVLVTFKELNKKSPISAESFYKRQGIFNQITNFIDRQVLEEDVNFTEKFPLNIN